VEVLRVGYTLYSAELQVWVAGRLSKWMATRGLRLVELRTGYWSGSA